MRHIRTIRQLLFQTLLCCCITCLYSCHKDNKPTPNNNTTDSTYIDSIIYTGCNYVGDYISFSFHIHGSGTIGISSLIWNFGDSGTSSSIDHANHIYSAPGTYTVTMAVNGGAPISTSITVVPYPTVSPYTAHIAGTRHWLGSGTGDIWELNLYNTFPYTIDTTLTIQVMNNGILKMPFISQLITLNLTTIDSTNQILTFTDCADNSIMLQYYYNIDSLVYTHY